MTVTALKKLDRVTHRVCPECGYVLSQLQVDLMRINPKCPRCSKHALSEFQPVKSADQHWEVM